MLIIAYDIERFSYMPVVSLRINAKFLFAIFSNQLETQQYTFIIVFLLIRFLIKRRFPLCTHNT